MSSALLSLILDVAVLLMLGVTIFYAARLSKSLNTFRQTRKEFGTLMENLTRNITEAQKAIDGMRAASDDAGRELQEILDESRLLADELQLMNDAGNSLASRLENLAEKNRRMAQGLEDPGEYGSDDEVFVEENKIADITSAKKGGNAPSFFIQDRDFDDDDETAGSDFQSQAERELFEALQKNKKSGKGAV